MKKTFHIPYYLPRVLAILLIAFISLFALDVFGEKDWFLALLIHLIPSYILAFATWVAWKNELIGGILLMLLGILFTFFTHFRALVISIPFLIIAGLFLIQHFQSKQKRKS